MCGAAGLKGVAENMVKEKEKLALQNKSDSRELLILLRLLCPTGLQRLGVEGGASRDLSAGRICRGSRLTLPHG